MSRVLIVDDAAVDRRLAGGLLRKLEDIEPLYAADGNEALSILEKEQPDVVVTDLQMPGMNGLELTEIVRHRFPYIPVVLITAHGSEEIAVQALQKGAASYVPKRLLAQDLAPTVASVLQIAQSARQEQRLLRSLIQTESYFELENDTSLIAPLIAFLQQALGRMQLGDGTDLIRISVALREALVNAMYHGNLEISSTLLDDNPQEFYRLVEERRRQEPYASRRVRLRSKESRQEVVYVISDEGPGFDPSSVPDPTDPANLEKSSGRGLLLIRTFMDEVYHNSLGNEITMIRRREPPAGAPPG
ncbi:MAG: hypothetical protein C4297_00825 [Gemmataceae bacterium]